MRKLTTLVRTARVCTNSFALVILAASLLLACADTGNPPPAITSLTPDLVSARVNTQATLKGENLYQLVVHYDVDKDERPFSRTFSRW